MGMGGGKLLVRGGDFPPGPSQADNAGIAGTQFWLEKPDNSVMSLGLDKKRGGYKVSYATGQGGHYRIVGYNGNEVRNGSRLHLFSFYEFMAHGDKPQPQPGERGDRRGYLDGRPVFELTRVYDSERGRFRSRAGDRAVVRVLFRGQPASDVPVTLTTARNWSKTARTDASGNAEFTLIKDVFQDGPFDKNRSSLFMLKAEHTEPATGQISGIGFEQERYVATLSFPVYPDSGEWESKRMAFLVAFATMLAAATAIGINRSRNRRRQRS